MMAATVDDGMAGPGDGPFPGPGVISPWRMIPTTTSAKFVEHILAPYDKLDDEEFVSFLYPAPEVVERIRKTHPGFRRINVLDHVRSVFCEHVADPEARHQVDDVLLGIYRRIEGHNFNQSDRYLQTYGDGDTVKSLDERHRPHDIMEFMRGAFALPYFLEDGTPSDGYVTFSVGGIHGAQYDQRSVDAVARRRDLAWERYDRAMAEWDEKVRERKAFNEALDKVSRDYPDTKTFRKAVEDGMDVVLTPHGVVASASLLTKGHALRRPRSENVAGKPREPRDPRNGVITPFIVGDNGHPEKLDTRYAMTSIGKVIHEDFSSYYPSMLTNQRAYWNEYLGYDPYAEIYDMKTVYGNLAKKHPEKAAHYMSERGGTKLILNSATGASDTKPMPGRPGDNSRNITMNNKILSMRLIGQMITWLIGQVQTFAGATIVSTNTDGLYSSLDDEELNNRLLEETTEPVNILIEPETIFLASKDANNRIEFEFVPESKRDGMHACDLRVLDASGGSLAAWSGPDVTKALSHPAILDYVTSQYLGECVLGHQDINQPVTQEWCRDIIDSAWACDDRFKRSFTNSYKAEPDAFTSLNMFAIVFAAKANPPAYPFGLHMGEGEPTVDDVVAWTHCNRVFMTRPMYSADPTKGSMLIRVAKAAKCTPATLAALDARNEQSTIYDDPMALKVLEHEHLVRLPGSRRGFQRIPSDRYATVAKAPLVPEDQPVLRVNQYLRVITGDPMRQQAMFDVLDRDAYAVMAAEAINKNWVNHRITIDG